MTAPAGRRGFTLVELLVVTGLFAAFFGLIVTALRPNANSQVRQLSQLLSSAILSARTRAIGDDAGAALILDPGVGAVPSHASNTIYNADVPPFVVGTIAGIPPNPPNVATATGTLSPTNADAADLAFGYKIRFSGSAPQMPPTAWMAFSSAGATIGTIGFRSAANQNINNSVWPAPPATGMLQFDVARYPAKSTSAFDTTRQAAIDFRHSGIGNATWGTSGTTPLAIVFDRNGSLDTVMTLGASPTWTNPTAPVYFLIASLTDIQNNQSLQSQTSRWLALNPSTGRVSIGANVVSGTDVIAARANARQGVTGGIK